MSTAWRPHPFHWVPADGQRHASHGRVADGDSSRMLCGEYAVAFYGVTAWLWATCVTCNIAAHELAGVPMVRAGHLEGRSVGAEA
ncbi:zinc finger protein [Saccharopolyspora sp. NPDC049426]|uniref:zinc finger protein n=1 Tax=Saccharopolyspora sp. NPDC049426 TaxID=3155652 RepID=UPI00341EABB2